MRPVIGMYPRKGLNMLARVKVKAMTVVIRTMTQHLVSMSSEWK